MKWIKKGFIFKTEAQCEWMESHSQCPQPLALEDRIRIYFSARQKGISMPTYIDVDKNNPQKVLYLNPEPVLYPGRLGTFDENGITPNKVLNTNNSVYLYYTGWSQAKNVPYKNFAGLAISQDNGKTFNKFSEGPIFGMNNVDSLSAIGPCVIKKDMYIAVYSTGVDWFESEGRLEHIYVLTYATSEDAINWRPTGKRILPAKSKYEAMCCPTIIKLNNIYHMWFSYRGSHGFRIKSDESYRIGYAYSENLLDWVRDDSKAGIDISETGWDSEMICYPCIANVDGKYLMFYNGNGFGREGFGYAELEI